MTSLDGGEWLSSREWLLSRRPDPVTMRGGETREAERAQESAGEASRKTPGLF